MNLVESRSSSSELHRSAAVTHFRKNPFRLLRLPISVKAQEAVWAAGKLATLRRAGIEPPTRDLLPWLPDADEIDAQEAIQRIEEPLRRLVDQLFWFDLTDNSAGAALGRALIAGDGVALTEYLAESTKAAKGAPVSRRLNAANLRLILGFSAMHGSGPVLSLGKDSAHKPKALFANPAATAKKKKRADAPAPRTAVDVHRAIDPAAEDPYERAWPELLAAGYREWHELLDDRDFETYVQEQIAKAGDELLSDDDSDTIRRAVATQLADLLAAELKRALATGRSDRVERLARIISNSSSDGEEWGHALRSLRPMFSAQLREADALLDDEAGEPLQNLDLYFNRARATLERWRSIDPSGLLDLTKLADRAVGDAFDRFEAITRADSRPEDVNAVLGSAASASTAESLKKRVAAFRERYEDFRQYNLCVYCHRRGQTEQTGVVVKGKKEVSRVRIYNGVRIQYSVRAALLPRCTPCSKVQKRIDSSKKAMFLGAFFAPLPLLFMVFNLFAVAVAIVGGLIVKAIWAAVLQAKVERLTGFHSLSVRSTPQWKALADEGFSLESVDTSDTAMARWLKEAR